MAEEGQEAMTVAEIERIIKTTEPREMSSNGDRVWTRRMAEALHGRLATVERTIANEALRKAAEVAAATIAPKSIGRDHGRHHEAGAQHAARRIRALIKETGHE